MISSNILHRQFPSICSFHRKHCKEGAAVTALCPLCYSDATMKLWMDTIRSNSQHLNSTACEPGITLSIHTHFSIYSSQTTNGTTRNLPKIVHGKTPKKRRKRELTHCSSLPAWCQRHSSPLHLPSKVSTAEVEKVEEDQREAAPWWWERLRAEEEGIRAWDGWMASLVKWTWIWANSRRWWGTGRPVCCRP